jgi:hypothetical protein
VSRGYVASVSEAGTVARAEAMLAHGACPNDSIGRALWLFSGAQLVQGHCEANDPTLD